MLLAPGFRFTKLEKVRSFFVPSQPVPQEPNIILTRPLEASNISELRQRRILI